MIKLNVDDVNSGADIVKAEININAMLNSLLDKFGIPDDRKKIIDDMRDIVTGFSRVFSVRVYKNEDFCNLLEGLGAERLKEIIEIHVNILKAQDEALAVIEGIRDDVAKRELQVKFYGRQNAYPLHLKILFNGANSDEVYGKFTSDNYVAEFIAIKEEALGLVEDSRDVSVEGVPQEQVPQKNVYELLLADEKDVIDSIRNVVTTVSSVFKTSYKLYSNDEFYNLLNQLGIVKVKDIIAIYLKDLREKDAFRAEVAAVIEIEEKYALTKKLEIEFKKLEDFYPTYLKWIFDRTDADGVYSAFVRGDYSNNFIKLKSDVKIISDFNKLCEGFSKEEKGTIAYMRSVVTDSNIGSVEGYKTYDDVEFNNLLHDLGVERLREIIKIHLSSHKAKNAALAAMNKAEESQKKQDLKFNFDVLSRGYASHLKLLFHAFNADYVYHDFMGSKYAALFTNFKNEFDNI
ncbi:BTA121 domain-containing protein surface lipoprotein [Borrelia turicatae]|uniref:Uncharacterized protein n=1 Tax=Borrelia turicatae (strain 91E135) TaxID=314724 RepID=A0A0R9PJ89_BORT9|nr:hypothetical protein [Borrelia turicatae]ALC78617.1 Hypothetical protein BTA130 [Borrelia turicatae 91E135]UPA14053.1 hypothetical protein bt91E135_001219 [Borrelia turicatae 91E135]